ncbi:pyruvate,water dikinase [Thermocatellispora tengchongensis]|uniref:Pyruvate,water dikinase n=1 Tax=Thermocatellispora tengchongensis TaxID=1073253 RepID=A0A840NXC8_9ACTN|nr:PEP/pyruvate-binding domain-containing protein [Thermocatellispora tengchongensis]MBB5132168.1 pyruvate,water dikinase [Thermocatellispora tengchongensis]
MNERFTAPLAAFGAGDLGRAGGKGANLGELVRAGFPVPGGFVVTTAAYDAVVRAAGLDAVIAAGLDRGDGAAIRAAFEDAPLPGALRREIAGAYARLGGGPVAVRSSATAEDLPGAAFAGQQDTYLNVIGEDALLGAVRRCWGSLWTDRAIAYRARRGIAPAGVRIAVVVQRMVPAEAAGVMFTADPVTGARDEIVVDAGGGLGEAVVSGLVTPDHYVLDRAGRVRAFTPGRGEAEIRPAEGGGVTRVPAADRAGASLPGPALRELARLGTAVAAHFGRPQDIEWAYADGAVHLLQARPMTAVPPPPVRLNAIQRRIGSVLLEYVPVRPYPMDMSTWVPHGPAGLMERVLNSVGLRRSFTAFLGETDGVVDRMVPPSPRPAPTLPLAPIRLLCRARRHDPARWTEDPRFTSFLRRAGELAARDPATLPWPELIALPRQALDLVRPVAGLRVDYLPGAGLALLRLLALLTLARRRRLFGDLILGARTRTKDANRALESLAARVREDPGLAAAFARHDPAELAAPSAPSAPLGPPGAACAADAAGTAGAADVADLAVAVAHPAFAAALRAFLAEYGHRETASPILVSPPTWQDDPAAVLGLVKTLVTAPAAPGGEERRVERAMRELLAWPPLRGRRAAAVAARWVEAARAGVAFREDTHFYFTKPLPVLRRALLEIGRRLRDAGVLAEPRDVFHLRLEELEAAGDPAALTDAAAARLRTAVRARSARREELTGVPLLDPALVFPVRRGAGALLTGTPGAGGTATGPARVIRGPAEFGRLAPGDVLVCPYTNPAWTPLFQRAAAVVADTGGVASHAAIVAREYGLPAVMGTVRGTSVLADGRVVTVDGTRGTVTAAERD